MTFAANFHDMMTDVIICQPGVIDATGLFTASGSPLSLACRITGRIRLVRDMGGREVVSSVQVLIGSFNNLTVNLHRYTIPSRFSPYQNLKAINVLKIQDENGPCHERVMFP